MFTGIIQAQSRVTAVHKESSILQVDIETPRGLKVQPGQSLSVNGVCSTVARIENSTLSFDYMPETITKTTVLSLTKNTLVNLEHSLTLSTPLDGHLVMGHVDGVAEITEITQQGQSKLFKITLGQALLDYIAPRGSVCIDGVSLTIAEKSQNGFVVSLIPYTLNHTNLGSKNAGDKVNIECDMIAKYLKELMRSTDHDDPVQ